MNLNSEQKVFVYTNKLDYYKQMTNGGFKKKSLFISIQSLFFMPKINTLLSCPLFIPLFVKQSEILYIHQHFFLNSFFECALGMN